MTTAAGDDGLVHVYDVAVDCGTFRNIDLFAKGLFMIRISARSGEAVGKPYAFSSDPSAGSSFTRWREAIPGVGDATFPKADVDRAAFTTRAFAIRFQDEHSALREGVQFQVVCPAPAGDGAPAFFDVTFELLVAEPPPGAGDVPLEWTSGAAFDVASTVSLRLERGHGFFPVVFSPAHLCQLDVTVHAALLRCRRRTRRGVPPEDAARVLAALRRSLGDLADALRTLCVEDWRRDPSLGDGVRLGAGEADVEAGLAEATTGAVEVEGGAKAIEGALFRAWGRFLGVVRATGSRVAARLRKEYLDDAAAFWAARAVSRERRVQLRAGKGCEIPNFKGSYLGRFPLVLAEFWTSDHLSERSRT